MGDIILDSPARLSVARKRRLEMNDGPDSNRRSSGRSGLLAPAEDVVCCIVEIGEASLCVGDQIRS